MILSSQSEWTTALQHVEQPIRSQIFSNDGYKRPALSLSHQNSSGNQTDKMSNPEERRPHVCPTCGKAYIKAAHLRDHQASAHDGVRYICAKCQKPFVKESYRNRHQQKCSGTIYTCSHCQQDFTSLQELRSHRTSAHQPQVNNRRRPHPPEARPSTSRGDAASASGGPSHATKSEQDLSIWK